MGKRILYLVRHGQLDMAAFAENQRTASLTATGRKQAHLTAKELCSLDVTAIHCSTIKRARDTAEIISSYFSNLVPRASRLLREVPNLDSVHFAGYRELAEQAFTKYVRPNRQKQRIEIVVSHGNLIRYFACRALGVAPESTQTVVSSHCGITQMQIGPDGVVQLICYNETGRMPKRVRS